MAHHDDGGPAFPVYIPGNEARGDHAAHGMSLRAYFAAHAPEEIPAWFTGPGMPTPEPALPDWRELPERLQVYARNWQADASYDFDEKEDGPELVEFQRKVEEAVEARDAWGRERLARDYFAWRWHYADQMLARRED